jgi:hypothetical protein
MMEKLGSTGADSVTVTGEQRCAISSRVQHQPASSQSTMSHVTAVRTAQVRGLFEPRYRNISFALAGRAERAERSWKQPTS